MSDFIRRRIAKLEARVAKLVRDGAYRRALESQEDVCRLTRWHLGEDHPSFVRHLDALAEIYRELGDEAAARRCYESSSQRLSDQIRTLYPQLLDEKHPSRLPEGRHALETARKLNRLAMLQWRLGEHQEATRMLRKALVLCRRQLGARHPGFAILINNLAEVYQSIGDVKKAEILYRRALKIFGETLGKDHPEFVQSLCALLSLYGT